MRVSVLVPAATALLFLLPLACENTPPANDPSQQNQYASGQYPPGQYPPGQGTVPGQYPSSTVPPGQTAPPVTTAPPAGTAPAGGQAQPITGPGAMAADAILTGLAQQEAAGQPEGTAFAGQFAEGQVLEQPINLQPGKCYTVVAASVGAVSELDVMLQAQLPPMPASTVAQDQGSGPTATLGGKAGCWKYPLPIAAPAKVVLRVTKGNGMAAAKVYMK
jgi:hypothetical protein